MLINYFEQYNIDTDDEKDGIKEKLNIISQSKTENADFLHKIFPCAMEYLFQPAKLETNQLVRGIPEHITSNTTVILFDNLLKDDKLHEDYEKISHQAKQLVLIGNHQSRRVNDKIICMNIHHFSQCKKLLKEADMIEIGFYVRSINFDRYYYGRMKTYFLNVLHSLSQLSIDELKRDVEGECTKLLLSEENFTSHHHVSKKHIKMKDMIKIYEKIISISKQDNRVVDEVFYLESEELNDYQVSMLNTISELFWLYRTKEKEEMISYAYDRICDQMLEEATKLKYCNFENNVCASARYTDNSFPNSKENGCCNNTYLDRRKNCRYLREDHSCAICSISCRVFTCAYLQRRGIDHSLWQYPLIDCVFSIWKRSRIIYGFFIPKEKMMKRF